MCYCAEAPVALAHHLLWAEIPVRSRKKSFELDFHPVSVYVDRSFPKESSDNNQNRLNKTNIVGCVKCDPHIRRCITRAGWIIRTVRDARIR